MAGWERPHERPKNALPPGGAAATRAGRPNGRGNRGDGGGAALGASSSPAALELAVGGETKYLCGPRGAGGGRARGLHRARAALPPAAPAKRGAATGGPRPAKALTPSH